MNIFWNLSEKEALIVMFYRGFPKAASHLPSPARLLCQHLKGPILYRDEHEEILKTSLLPLFNKSSKISKKFRKT